MNLPPTVKIGPYLYRITTAAADLEREHLYGDIHYGHQRIRVSEELGADQQAVVVLHEVIHGVREVSGLKDKHEDVWEEFISGLAPGLLQVLRNNPSFVLFLLGPDALDELLDHALEVEFA